MNRSPPALYCFNNFSNLLKGDYGSQGYKLLLSKILKKKLSSFDLTFSNLVKIEKPI